jgi:hypothetical protein
MHAHLPLGMEGFLLRPGRHMLYVLSTADSPVFEGWHLAENGAQKLILDRNGTPVRYFPQKLHFRVTASTMLDLIGADTAAAAARNWRRLIGNSVFILGTSF